jgi:hypothetical protein
MTGIEAYQEVRRLQLLGRKLRKQFGFKPEQRGQLEAIKHANDCNFANPRPGATTEQMARWAERWMQAYNRQLAA